MQHDDSVNALQNRLVRTMTGGWVCGWVAGPAALPSAGSLPSSVHAPAGAVVGGSAAAHLGVRACLPLYRRVEPCQLLHHATPLPSFPPPALSLPPPPPHPPAADGFKNPNGCNVPATWFALKDKTNCTLVQQLLKDNHGGRYWYCSIL